MDDLSERVDAGFARVDRDIRELRTEMGSLRTEMRAEIGDLRTEMMRFGAGIIVAVVVTSLLSG